MEEFNAYSSSSAEEESSGPSVSSSACTWRGVCRSRLADSAAEALQGRRRSIWPFTRHQRTSFGSCWKLGRTSHATGFFIQDVGKSSGGGAGHINSIAPLLSPKRSKQRPLSSHDRRSNRGPAEIRPLREARYRAPRSSDASDHCELFAGESIKAIRPNKLVRLLEELSQSRGTRLHRKIC